MTDPRPKSPNHSMFAVWRWKWWVWLAMALTCAAYPFSLCPAAYLLTANGYREVVYSRSFRSAYLPVMWLAERNESIGGFFEWQFGLVEKLFGELPDYDDPRLSPDWRPLPPGK